MFSMITVYIVVGISVLNVKILALEVSSCKTNGIYADHLDCTKFYLCAPFGPVSFQCPAGLYFNPAVLSCDWPEQVGCIASTTPPPHELVTESSSRTISSNKTTSHATNETSVVQHAQNASYTASTQISNQTVSSMNELTTATSFTSRNDTNSKTNTTVDYITNQQIRITTKPQADFENFQSTETKSHRVTSPGEINTDGFSSTNATAIYKETSSEATDVSYPLTISNISVPQEEYFTASTESDARSSNRETSRTTDAANFRTSKVKLTQASTVAETIANTTEIEYLKSSTAFEDLLSSMEEMSPTFSTVDESFVSDLAVTDMGVTERTYFESSIKPGEDGSVSILEELINSSKAAAVTDKNYPKYSESSTGKEDVDSTTAVEEFTVVSDNYHTGMEYTYSSEDGLSSTTIEKLTERVKVTNEESPGNWLSTKITYPQIENSNSSEAYTEQLSSNDIKSSTERVPLVTEIKYINTSTDKEEIDSSTTGISEENKGTELTVTPAARSSTLTTRAPTAVTDRVNQDNEYVESSTETIENTMTSSIQTELTEQEKFSNSATSDSTLTISTGLSQQENSESSPEQTVWLSSTKSVLLPSSSNAVSNSVPELPELPTKTVHLSSSMEPEATDTTGVTHAEYSEYSTGTLKEASRNETTELTNSSDENMTITSTLSANTETAGVAEGEDSKYSSGTDDEFLSTTQKGFGGEAESLTLDTRNPSGETEISQTNHPKSTEILNEVSSTEIPSSSSDKTSATKTVYTETVSVDSDIEETESTTEIEDKNHLSTLHNASTKRVEHSTTDVGVPAPATSTNTILLSATTGIPEKTTGLPFTDSGLSETKYSKYSTNTADGSSTAEQTHEKSSTEATKLTKTSEIEPWKSSTEIKTLLSSTKATIWTNISTEESTTAFTKTEAEELEVENTETPKAINDAEVLTEKELSEDVTTLSSESPLGITERPSSTDSSILIGSATSKIPISKSSMKPAAHTSSQETDLTNIESSSTKRTVVTAVEYPVSSSEITNISNEEESITTISNEEESITTVTVTETDIGNLDIEDNGSSPGTDGEEVLTTIENGVETSTITFNTKVSLIEHSDSGASESTTKTDNKATEIEELASSLEVTETSTKLTSDFTGLSQTGGSQSSINIENEPSIISVNNSSKATPSTVSIGETYTGSPEIENTESSSGTDYDMFLSTIERQFTEQLETSSEETTLDTRTPQEVNTESSVATRVESASNNNVVLPSSSIAAKPNSARTTETDIGVTETVEVSSSLEAELTESSTRSASDPSEISQEDYSESTISSTKVSVSTATVSFAETDTEESEEDINESTKHTEDVEISSTTENKLPEEIETTSAETLDVTAISNTGTPQEEPSESSLATTDEPSVTERTVLINSSTVGKPTTAALTRTYTDVTEIQESTRISTLEISEEESSTELGEESADTGATFATDFSFESATDAATSSALMHTVVSKEDLPSSVKSKINISSTLEAEYTEKAKPSTISTSTQNLIDTVTNQSSTQTSASTEKQTHDSDDGNNTTTAAPMEEYTIVRNKTSLGVSTESALNSDITFATPNPDIKNGTMEDIHSFTSTIASLTGAVVFFPNTTSNNNIFSSKTSESTTLESSSYINKTITTPTEKPTSQSIVITSNNNITQILHSTTKKAWNITESLASSISTVVSSTLHPTTNSGNRTFSSNASQDTELGLTTHASNIVTTLSVKPSSLPVQDVSKTKIPEVVYTTTKKPANESNELKTETYKNVSVQNTTPSVLITQITTTTTKVPNVTKENTNTGNSHNDKHHDNDSDYSSEEDSDEDSSDDSSNDSEDDSDDDDSGDNSDHDASDENDSDNERGDSSKNTSDGDDNNEDDSDNRSDDNKKDDSDDDLSKEDGSKDDSNDNSDNDVNDESKSTDIDSKDRPTENQNYLNILEILKHQRFDYVKYERFSNGYNSHKRYSSNRNNKHKHQNRNKQLSDNLNRSGSHQSNYHSRNRNNGQYSYYINKKWSHYQKRNNSKEENHRNSHQRRNRNNNEYKIHSNKRLNHLL